MHNHKPASHPLHSFIVYASLYSLVFAYAHAYQLWTLLSTELGVLSNYFPIAAVILLMATAYPLLIRSADFRIQKNWLMLAIACLFIALLIPDFQFPAKRIHVVEYLFLSLLVFIWHRRFIAGRTALIVSILLCVLYGMHDEMIQGLLANRTFGLRDILVNSMASAGGVLLGFSVLGQAKSDQPVISHCRKWQHLKIAIYCLLTSLPMYWLAAHFSSRLHFH